ncbi:MAG: hypothetical protein ABR976_17165 [Terracidiphilus sp.]
MPRLIDHWLVAGRLEFKTKAISNFRAHESQYAELISAFRTANKTLPPCGLPGPIVGTVEFRAFAVKPDRSYRVVIHGDGTVVPSLQEAARTLNTDAATIQTLAGALKAVDRPGIYQSGATVSIPIEDGSSYGVLFVPASCRVAANFESWSRNGSSSDVPLTDGGSYANLFALGNGWYYYLAWR